MVESLKMEDDWWNKCLVRDSFLWNEVSLILSIPCFYRLLPGKLLWHSDKLGCYFIKSGYYLAMSLSSNPSSFFLGVTESWWKYLWRIKVPSKIKLLIKRACHDWVPSATNMSRRGIDIIPSCPVCKRPFETTTYALWNCPDLKGIRNQCGLLRGVVVGEGTSFLDFMIFCMSCLLPTDLELLCTLI